MVRIEKTKDFYETMCLWLSDHGWAPIQLKALPENIFVLSNDVEDCYCCTLYETDSAFGFVAWPISNKKATRNSYDITVLFEEIEKYAKTKGIEILFTTSGTQKIENSLVNAGYKLGDTNVNQYIKWI